MFSIQHCLHESARVVRMFAFALVALAIVGTANAWTANTSTPPSNDAPAPIHVGAAAQTKAGSLEVGTGSNGTLTIGNNTDGNVLIGSGTVIADTFCLGTSCINSWPTGSGSGGSGSMRVQSGEVDLPKSQGNNTTVTKTVTLSGFSAPPHVIISPLSWESKTWCTDAKDFKPIFTIRVQNVTATSLTIFADQKQGECDEVTAVTKVSYLAIGN